MRGVEYWTHLAMLVLNIATGGQAQGKGVQGAQKAQNVEKDSRVCSKSAESGPSVTMANQIHITVHGVGDKDGKHKEEAMDSSTRTTEGRDTEAKGAAKPTGREKNEFKITYL